jgi:cytochrome c
MKFPLITIILLSSIGIAQAASAEKGKALVEKANCASCHGASPVLPGKHASTGKTIAPLAPLVNPDRFSDSAKVEKWFRRNCKDVLSRECTPLEKADVVAYVKDMK